MNTDIILYIFQACDSYTKIPLSLTGKNIYDRTRLHVQPLKNAVENSDVFSIVNNIKWHDVIDIFELGKIGSEFLITSCKKYRIINGDTVFYGACSRGHINIMANMINIRNCDQGLCYACREKQINAVKFIIERGTYETNYKLYGACLIGNMDIVNQMTQQDIWNWNLVLEAACIGGNIKIVERIIACGASALNRGLAYAHEAGHKDIVRLMIKLGATS